MYGKWQERINILFHLHGRAVYTRQGFIFALILLLRDVTFSFICTLRHPYFATSISSEKTKLGKLTPDLFQLFCLENGMR